MSLGVNGTGEFRISTTGEKNSFFSIQKFQLPSRIDLLAGFDQDGDNIDDYFELNSSTVESTRWL